MLSYPSWIVPGEIHVLNTMLQFWPINLIFTVDIRILLSYTSVYRKVIYFRLNHTYLWYIIHTQTQAIN